VSSDEVVDALVQTWNARESEKCVVYRDGETHDRCLAQGVELIQAYLRDPPPERIVAVEHEMIVPIQNSHSEYLEKPLVAISDLITEHDAGLKVTELKTGSRAYSEADVKTSLQPLCYVHAVTETFCKPVDVEFVVLVKTKTPKVQRRRVAQSGADAGRLGDIVQAIERAITSNAFYPVESALNCSTCPFRSPCREWSRKSVTPATASATDLPDTESVCSSN
jgi:putative RecB family exonuclease